METKIITNGDLHFEHMQWNSELAFWKDELRTFQHRLDELVKRWTVKEVLKGLDHYQNELSVHRGVIEELLEEIQAHEMHIAAQEASGKVSMNTALVSAHLAFRKKMERQREMYIQLKKDFYQFLSKYM